MGHPVSYPGLVLPNFRQIRAFYLIEHRRIVVDVQDGNKDAEGGGGRGIRQVGRHRQDVLRPLLAI